MKVPCYCPDLSEQEFSELDLQEFDLSGKTFYCSKTPMVSHFPMNPELKIEKTLAEIEKKGFRAVSPLFAVFQDGLLVGNIMIEIVKPSVTDSSVRTLGEIKLTGRTFTGPKYLVPKALKEFDRYLMQQNIMTTDFYFWYHSCKQCEKTKGNRTVIMGKIN